MCGCPYLAILVSSSSTYHIEREIENNEEREGQSSNWLLDKYLPTFNLFTCLISTYLLHKAVAKQVTVYRQVGMYVM